MPEIEIGFCAVFSNEDLTVLERTHRSRIHIDIGVQLEMGDLETAGFQDRTQRSSGNALTQRGHHSAGDKNVFGHEKYMQREIRIVAQNNRPR